jgi:isoleucyl-tRNA synthetase
MAEDKGPSQSPSRSNREERVLQFWKDNKIFEKTLSKPARPDLPGGGDFVFYEGPPGANGHPGVHHMESRFFKDAIPRYKTMRGYHVPRKAGWDTHGLPVELEAEKVLGIVHKKEIEELGVEKFNAECRKIVWKYVDEWERISDRIGFWLNFKDAYVTYHNSYIESVWSVVKKIDEQKLLYKDYKVLPWCPRCETALSSHELAQGYADVKDLSLYVKFKVSGQENTYILAWTTTPWTLPGNLALAVGEKIDYVKIKKGEEYFILAEARLSVVEGEYEVVEKMKGKDLVGLAFEPLYNFVTPNAETYKVYPADFVTTEDGTGIVHTAVMYGQDDFELGTKVGLPKVHLVNPDATFKKEAGWLAGRSVVDETLAVDILKDLQSRGLLFAKENHLHSYPFCWRCKTRLIYYARDSWYIRMSSLRDKLMSENEKINWEPEYIKEGRFGEWLREVKDWAVSRERYWATPLPVWLNEDGEKLVVDSLETLKKYTQTNGNTFIFVRHGEAESNANNFVNSDPKVSVPLTDKGKEEAKAVSDKIKKIDAMYVSPYERTKETAEIIAKERGFDVVKIKEDERLTELNFGDLNGKKYTDFLEYEEKYIKTYDTPLPNGESYNDAKKRFGNFLYDIDTKHKDETIVVVTHGMGLEASSAIIEGADPDRSKEIIDTMVLAHTGGMLEFQFVPLPHNANYELDLHRPYIDEVVLEKSGKEYRRVKEVMDVWFDSGSMPFASGQAGYPADFISEGLDQTRGWFYTLHAVGVLMEQGRAFKNVICLGLLLDKDGKKMSKSVGNVLDPWAEIEKYGVDVLRFWMYSINQPGENKNYDDRTVKEVEKRVFNLIDNVHAFYELYRDRAVEGSEAQVVSKNILDTWIMLRLAQVAEEVAEHLDNYKLLEPTRDLRDFVDDLSTWYVRRSRERVKDGEVEVKKTLYVVLKELSKLLAPFAPFAAEELYQKLKLKGESESVHLSPWPEFWQGDELQSTQILASMKDVRRLTSLALESRSRANLKIRQPLAKLTVRAELTPEFLEILRDEVNVKQVVLDNSMAEEVMLETNLTPELIEEGALRDLIRQIQELRKEKGLKPGDKLEYDVPEAEKKLFEKFGALIQKTTNVVPHL